eukprot:CAMPEP_0197904224 /NCGR_PEP_ID=MMETSP1439-20131203/57630_1 /TAXON_ID=66791 /ORGANISM="Gonyaulax spinifera, Strain CCMP409" /LENGTH=100 /DNA_ID=CAMNT_0043525395 /DNA_START=69 /DNA_END=368 /DNA_ORIENTATION=-
MKSIRPFVTWTIVVCQLGLLEGKLQKGSVGLGDGGADSRWQYISKFGFGIGIGEYEVRLKLRQPWTLPGDAQLDFDMYLDEDWHRVESRSPCERASDSLS